MSTSKESTLQINKFDGIDQYDAGTVIPPSKFYNLQNMYVKSEGELKALNGVTNLTSNSLAGVESLKHVRFLDFDASVFCLYNPNYTTIVAPSGQTYATSGGGAVSRNVTLVFVGAGNSFTKSAYAVQSIQANGLTVTLPTNIPDYIFCVHVYVENAAGGYANTAIWAGSFTRKSGNFPSSIIVPVPIASVATASPVSIAGRPVNFAATFGTNGSLESGRIYYFGFAPWVGGKPQTVAFYNNSSKGYAIYLPDGKSSISLFLDYLPWGIPQNTTSPSSSDLEYTKLFIVAGLSIEDGIPVGSDKTDGTQTPVAVSSASVNFSNTTTNVDLVNDELIVPGVIPDLALLKYTTAGTPPTGMATNTYYWVRNPSYTATTTVFQISATIGGPIIDLTAFGTGLGTFNWKQATVVLRTLPENSDLWAMCDDLNSDGSRVGRATNPRLTGLVDLNDNILGSVSSAPKGFGGFVLTTLPHIPSVRREVLSCRNQKALYITDHSTNTSVPSEFYVSSSNPFQSRTYVGRLWLTNGLNSPFYSNGYVLKPATVDNNSRFFPITDFIEFFQNRLILAGGDGDAVTYSKGTFTYSDSGNPNFFGSAVLNSKPVRFGDESDIQGLAIYSQDLSTLGPQTYLITGKRDSIYTWDGDVNNGAQQIDRETGFAGPNCFTRTRFGPVFVGRDNVYYLQNSQLLIPMGDDIRNIIQGLTDDQLLLVDVIDHEEQVKVAYPSSDNGQLDREIWLKFIYNNGGLSKKWSGPHLRKPFTSQAITSSFADERDYRVCLLGSNLYRRDDPGSFLNDGALIQRSIKINRLGLSADHFLKVINRVYLALRIVQDEEIDVTIETEDGSQSQVFSETAFFDDGEHQMKQVWIPQRMLARIFSISIENASDADMSIYDISFLFQMLKRRMIP